DACHYFTDWSGDYAGMGNPLSVTMDDNKGILANFSFYTYGLTTSVNDPAMGSVTPGAPNYTCGTSVADGLTPTANEGYVFTHWSGDASGSVVPLPVTMDKDKEIVANFEEKRYLTLGASAGGSVSANPDHTSTYYVDGESVTITATPANGWAFSHWTGSASGSVNPLTVTMDGDKNITAVFKLKRYLGLSTSGNGGGAITAEPDKTATYYLDGESVTLTAVPGSACDYFSNWAMSASGAVNPLLITMDGDKAVDAVFMKYQYSVGVGTTDGGGASGSNNYNCGDTVTAQAYPDPGYVFTEWTGDYTGTDNPAQFTCTGNMTVIANFARHGLTLSESRKGGSLTLSSSLYSGGLPVKGKTVKFFARKASGATWALKASGLSLADGSCTKKVAFAAGDWVVKSECTTAPGMKFISDEVSFTVSRVTLSSPATASVTTDDTPTVAWEAYPGATGYIVEVSAGTGFYPSTTLQFSAGGGVTEMDLPAFNIGQKKFWRVTAQLSDGQSLPSLPWSLTYREATSLINFDSGLSGNTIRPSVRLVDGSALPMAGRTVVFQYKPSGGGSWLLLGSDVTDASGDAVLGFTKNLSVSSYEIRASFKGNASYMTSEALLAIAD
ncbi:MAG TPA: hypothetical protein VJM83_03540, partial [Nitrospirota bacterium]|nr:hypothetical protein [Nitrospirota bacterium]